MLVQKTKITTAKKEPMSNQSTANAKPRKSTEADTVLSVELSYMGFYCDNNIYANHEKIDYKGHLS